VVRWLDRPASQLANHPTNQPPNQPTRLQQKTGLDALIPAPDPQALQAETEARQGVYLTLPWLLSPAPPSPPPVVEGGGEDTTGRPSAAASAAATAGAGAAASTAVAVAASASGEAEAEAALPPALLSSDPYPRVLVVDSWASLRVAEEVILCVLCVCVCGSGGYLFILMGGDGGWRRMPCSFYASTTFTH
jgi:hypothetical protein